MVRWEPAAKVAFVGSHGIRKTTAAHGFAGVLQRAGRTVEYGREVVRDNPLGMNEGATPEAQLWVLVSQVRQELELTGKAEVVVLDRGVMDNFVYYRRACAGTDPFDVEPLVRRWSGTYDLVVRLLPDVALRGDGVRSTSEAFRDEIEGLLDEWLPVLVPEERLVTMQASEVGDATDWWGVAERLAALRGVPLFADGVPRPRRRVRRRSRRRPEMPQLAFDD
ncbi:MAG TPA: hypothetical protein ENK55_12205 [Actinobacteria bacterium]|nr:hypothetical protein [Actinomycetota bacterium]